jgi:hypothetical protein
MIVRCQKPQLSLQVSMYLPFSVPAVFRTKMFEGERKREKQEVE